MDSQVCTLGFFPPEESWGVFASTTCPDLGGGFVQKYRYHQYPETPGIFHLLLAVRGTLVELGIKPDHKFVYPLLEEVQTWKTGGEILWKKRAGK